MFKEIESEKKKISIKDENYEFFKKIKIIRCDEIIESNFFNIRSRFKIFNYFIYSSSIRKYGCRKKFNYSKNNL